MSGPDLSGLLTENREELNRIDSKANLLLTVDLALVTGLGFAVFDPSTVWRCSGITVVVASALSLAFALAALALLGLATYPVTGKPTAGQARYFAEQAQFVDVDSMVDAVSRLDERDRVGQQVLVTAKLLARKYRLIQVAIIVAASALAIFLFSGAIITLR